MIVCYCPAFRKKVIFLVFALYTAFGSCISEAIFFLSKKKKDVVLVFISLTPRIVDERAPVEISSKNARVEI